jgi:hypothetical protein
VIPVVWWIKFQAELPAGLGNMKKDQMAPKLLKSRPNGAN